MKKITISLILMLLLSSCVNTTKAPNGDGSEVVTQGDITGIQESGEKSTKDEENLDNADQTANNENITQEEDTDMTELTPDELEQMKNSQAINDFQKELEDLIITAQEENE